MAETYHNLYPSANTGSDSRWIVPATALRAVYTNDDNTTYNNVQKFPSTFYVGVDLEKYATTLFCGQSTRTSQAQLEITIATANTTTLQATTFALLDVVVIIDVESKTIMVMN